MCVHTTYVYNSLRLETGFKDWMFTKVNIYGTSYYEILLISKREHAIHMHNNFSVSTDN